MKNVLIPIFFFLTLPLLAQVRADFTYSRFFAPGQGAYIETYFNVDGQSVAYDTLPSGYQARLEATLSFEQDSAIKDFKKYEILGPVLTNPDSFIADFVDVQRFMLPDGDYSLNIALRDLNNTTSKGVMANQPMKVSSSYDALFFSDVLFVQEAHKAKEGDLLVKAGYGMIPYVYDYFPTAVNKLTFYTELYNVKALMGDTGAVVIKYYLRDLARNRTVDGYGAYKRFGAQEVSVLFGTMDISKLPTGNYALEIEAYGKSGELVASQRVLLDRVNDNVQALADVATKSGSFEDWVMNIGSRDSLQHMMMCLIPIAGSEEQMLIMKHRKNPDNNIVRKIIIDFWLDRNPLDPWSDYLTYEKEVQKANAEFSTQNSPGYESDRGFIYLKYGAPNTMVKRENEPSSYPYHIWHYYQHPKRTDARYVFYNTDLVTNDYRLLHSNVIGEVNNPRWQRDLERRNTPFGNVDDEAADPHFGGWSEDLFNMPR